ncbi:hypothetical protein EON65_59090, partial [archaeon]
MTQGFLPLLTLMFLLTAPSSPITLQFRKNISLDDRITKWRYIIDTDSPFATFDKASFWAMFPEGDSLTANGMRPSFTALVSRVENDIVGKLKKQPIFSMTTDGWTSMALRGHTTLTLHWLDKDFEGQSVVLGAPLISGSATGENLYLLLSTRLKRFGVSTNQLSSICIDQGTNYQAMARTLVAAPALPCICHLLNHILEDVAQEVFPHIITWANKLVSTVKNSSINRRALEEAQSSSGRPLKHIKAASSTRWFYYI